MRYFEYKDDKSSKFWEVEQQDNALNLRWGKIGTNGQSQTKEFSDEAKATAAMNKLITEKTKKGYLELVSSVTEKPQTLVMQKVPEVLKMTIKEQDYSVINLPKENNKECEDENLPPWFQESCFEVNRKAECPPVVMKSRIQSFLSKQRGVLAENASQSLDILLKIIYQKDFILASERHWAETCLPEIIKKLTRLAVDCTVHEQNFFFISKEVEEEYLAVELLPWFNLPESIEALARMAYACSKQSYLYASQRALTSGYQNAIKRCPAAVIAGLAKLIALDEKEGVWIKNDLITLIKRFPELAQRVTHFIGPLSASELKTLIVSIQGPKEVALSDELPKILVSPPWLRKKAKITSAALELDFLTIATIESNKKNKEPDWHQAWLADIKNDPLKHLGIKKFPSALAAFNEQDGVRLADIWIASKECYLHCIEAFPEKLAISFINHAVPFKIKNGQPIYDCENVLRAFGLKVLPAMLAVIASKPVEYLPLILDFGIPEFAPAAAHAFSKTKTLQKIGRQWLLRYPEHAIVGLLPTALGKRNAARNSAAAALRFLALGHNELLKAVATRYQQPAVLDALQLVLDEDPLDRYPTKRSPFPAFWQAQTWRRPRLKNGKALPNEALDILGTMLTFPINEEIYQGLLDVKEACTEDSLADFAWDLFGAWLNNGAPNKDNWAMTALASIGNDNSARKLTSYIREWPSEGAFGRAVAGLDVLAKIGSDISLMFLNGIAQKVKSKGLQDKAREKIDEIAEIRGFASEELEDRIVPDLGLDERGTLLLDFGSRQFKVDFDEVLKPYVREFDVKGKMGKRLPNLPKPNKSDDTEKSNAAIDLFKLLKKNVKTVANQQVFRLEMAMCSRRRWSSEIFKKFLVEHPLMRHLVQRLIWGIYELPLEEQYGGKLLFCFRVSEDGNFTNVQDDALALPDNQNLKIGLPHALEISPEEAANFGQLFSDYELIQPFEQIRRSAYTLTNEEKKSTNFTRYQNLITPTGKILGLVNKGWRRGAVQDGACISYFTKPLNAKQVLQLNFEPGIIAGMANDEPEQTLGEINVGCSGRWGIENFELLETLDSISASELIRDMESLRG